MTEREGCNAHLECTPNGHLKSNLSSRIKQANTEKQHKAQILDQESLDYIRLFDERIHSRSKETNKALIAQAMNVIHFEMP